MTSKFLHVAKKALPITLKEFRKSLISSCGLHAEWGRHPITLGLAISGGVDSMALASLCARLQDENWRFQAFIVDHGARPGSYQEANEVAELVKKQGIEAAVLKIKWPEDVTPSQSSKFESLARKYRYRILGTACRNSGVRNLMLAHHEDDQYETLLMRLAMGHKGQGLCGIKTSSRIPECDGIYGVYSSGTGDGDILEVPLPRPETSKELGESFTCEVRTRLVKSPFSTDLMGRRLIQQDEEAGGERTRGEQEIKKYFSPFLKPMAVEDGSIRVLRPLLSYSKDRLIATSRHYQTSWFDDITNSDRTLTPRNALRDVFKGYSLPAALQKKSILALSTRLRQKHDFLETHALSLLDLHSIWSFEPRAGSLSIRFPKLSYFENGDTGIDDKIALEEVRRGIAWRILRYSINAVSPTEGVRFQRLDEVSRNIYPELNQAKGQFVKRLDCFTVAGVMFQRQEIKNLPLAVLQETVSDIRKHKTSKTYSGPTTLQDCRWVLSRQPHESSVERQPILEYSPSTIFKDKFSGWKYYDGRYWIWIRVLDQSSDHIRVRPFREEDLKGFNKLDSKSRQTMLHRLKAIAPGPIRFTLPVIVRPKTESGKEEMVLALPTLDIVVPGAEKLLEYKVRYKEVVWPSLLLIQKSNDVPAPSGPKVNCIL